MLTFDAHQQILLATQIHRSAGGLYECAINQRPLLIASDITSIGIGHLQYVDYRLGSIGFCRQRVYHFTSQVIGGQIQSNGLAVNIETNVLIL